MGEFLSYRNGNKTDEQGTNRFMSKITTGDVISGMLVVQAVSPNMTVTVQPGDCIIADTNYKYNGWVDADKVLTITTANPSNPRIDSIVAYVDKALVDTTNSNSPLGLKLAVVAGTPAASPTAPSAGTIQTAIGASNPYIVLSNVTVGTSVTSIVTANIARIALATTTTLPHSTYGLYSGQQIFTASGSYAKPTGLKYVIVEVLAGGGAGGGTIATSATQHSIGSGGGAGAYARKKILASALAASETVTVGAGGVAALGANGGSGGTSSFGAFVSCTGGAGGVANLSVNTGGVYQPGNIGGTATGGDLNIDGGGGQLAGTFTTTNNVCYSGAGANSPLGFGFGGRSLGANSGGITGTGYGAGGGGGASSISNSAQLGGAGRQGIVIITEYF
jgi:hypothetical protein